MGIIDLTVTSRPSSMDGLEELEREGRAEAAVGGRGSATGDRRRGREHTPHSLCLGAAHQLGRGRARPCARV
jgi:hypothetical protein